MVQIPLYEAGKLIFLKAITPIHVGTGRTYGEAVDLPIQRDEFGIPVIWGSSLKGAIRAQRESIANQNLKRLIKAVFGPDESRESEGIEGASSISILDAKLVMIPVKALKGLYTYVTSNHLLQQFMNYLEITKGCAKKHNVSNDICTCLRELINIAKNVDEGHAITSSDKYTFTIDNTRKVILNDQFYEIEIDKNLRELVSKCFGTILSPEEIERFIIVSDYDIHDLIKTSLQVITRVRLKYETKTVDTGPWTEEYLPSNTVLVAVILYSRPRMLRVCEEKEKLSQPVPEICKELKEYDVTRIWNEILNLNEKYLILGGHETIGKGILWVKSYEF